MSVRPGSLARFVFVGGVLVLGCAPPMGNPGEQLDAEERRIEQGLLRGVHRANTLAFLGIPYAQPPVGELRFRPTARATPWEGELEASDYGAACRQIYYDGRLIGDEDCLTLNVWTPAEPPATALPVMVYLHGGDNQYGSSGESNFYDGRTLVGEHGVVLVTVNYRLGAFGFLSDPAFAAENAAGATGNYGLHDQIEALRWVQRNIAAFGGDPQRVMLFGQSAGAGDTCALLASPLAAGLFHRALMQSLNCEVATDAIIEATWTHARTSLGCAVDGEPADVAACLRAASPDDLAALPTAVDEVGGDYYYNVDGVLLTEEPVAAIAAGRGNHMPVVLGNTEDEFSSVVDYFIREPYPADEDYENVLGEVFGAALVPQIVALYPLSEFPSARRAIVEVVSDYLMHCSSRRVTRALRRGQREPVWVYNFAHGYATGPLAEYGAAHAFETTYIFNTFESEEIVPTDEERLLSGALQMGWTSFARDGVPVGPNGFAWALHDEDDLVTRLDWPLSIEPYAHNTRCDFWDTQL